MTRDEVIDRLKPHEAQFRAAGLERLYLFGSTARNEAGESSDVDLACEIDDTKNIGLLELIGFKQDIAGILKQPVDLIERHRLRRRIKERAEQDMVRVF
jgi:uncharacterized protein